ncbi:type II toxin-antitoxin system death-on-curing family toxin [Luteipulveratus mongoliensis]|uniref:type II toxin-antitoxin system death-on-curing family toxin n=1 Tax=Luteipulveratus mongoliensis TaxID=571913 RepID=UPI0012EED775|nr:Fic family protein [Luteipulveratus mongoliensis]
MLDDVKHLYTAYLGAGELRDEGLLEGAVSAPFQEVFGQVLYPTVAERAAKLLDGVQRAQAYSDGNKRIAWLSTVTFLNLNGRTLRDFPAEEGDEFVRSLVHHEDAQRHATLWIADRMRSNHRLRPGVDPETQLIRATTRERVARAHREGPTSTEPIAYVGGQQPGRHRLPGLER